MKPRPLKVVVVDDEPLARQALRQLLDPSPQAQVVGEFSDGEAALAAVSQDPPDVLLVDIQMPKMDGLELVRRLGSPPPLVIFVTAYDRYALHAFRSLALDYLLKPCSQEDMEQALRRARERLESDQLADLGRRMLRWANSESPMAEKATTEGHDYLQRFTARKRRKTVMIQVEDIEWIEADDYCVRVHVAGDTHVLRRSLKWFGERLDPSQFIRAHRSALMNLTHLREIQHRGSGDHVAVLTSGDEIPLSRGGREALSQALPLL